MTNPEGPAPKKAIDVALVGDSSEDGSAPILRKRGDRVEFGILREAKEGAPLHGELVRLRPRGEPRLYDVEVLHDARARNQESQEDQKDTGSSGRARVSNSRYRAGWDRVFGRNPKALPN